MHLTHAGHKRGESADDRYESGNDDGLSSVFPIELMSLVQVFLFEDAVVSSVKKFLPEKSSGQVVPETSC